ncbi:type I-F CRISPR-associated protein Csy1 [Nitrincola sp.]|uniref:type I-F CRISPR-associated protein Csy1 n=1 Tax=Nitrincola sp. TaxID=1926584 RepID=UPI003A938667
MNEEDLSSTRSKCFHAVIVAFINERRDAKLKGKEEDAATAAKYDYATWLADAARRVSQIQAVTHILKATHPDARGSSLHLIPDQLPQHEEIGSHLLGADFAEDVVGNAAALDVFKFLKLEVEGLRLLDWMQKEDADLQAALSSEPELAKEWMQAFACLVRTEQEPVSHPMAKQIYWLVGDEPSDNNQYHLLQPLFSSSLAHKVHADIQDVRFGETNKLARQAYRAKEAHEGCYRDYKNLAVRKLGGTKPQNISQLNSERGGVNYLLPSLPPVWNKAKPVKLLNVDSVWTAFLWFDEVRQQVRSLADFLLSVVDQQRNKSINDQRMLLEQGLGLQLAIFAAYVADANEPGWTRDSACRLPLCEQLWLDPERTELPLRKDHEDEDRAFNSAFIWGDWPDEVAGRFASWLNSHFHEAGLISVGDAENRHWAKQAIIDAAWPVTMQRYATGGHV